MSFKGTCAASWPNAAGPGLTCLLAPHLTAVPSPLLNAVSAYFYHKNGRALPRNLRSPILISFLRYMLCHSLLFPTFSPMFCYKALMSGILPSALRTFFRQASSFVVDSCLNLNSSEKRGWLETGVLTVTDRLCTRGLCSDCTPFEYRLGDTLSSLRRLFCF
jgi:hypothetical protein